MSESPLHVVMVSRRVHPAHGPGGMERNVHDLTTRLARRGITCRVVHRNAVRDGMGNRRLRGDARRRGDPLGSRALASDR